MATIVLVPGMWLGAWAWREVTAVLRDSGHQVYPLTLTGVADRAHLSGADLDTHTADIVGLIEAEELRDVVLVGHSYGGLPVTAAAERIPDRIARVVYVDSGPLPDGTTQQSMLPPGQQPPTDGDTVPAPPWNPADDPDNLAGLDEATLASLRVRATPHPLGSVTQPLRRTGELGHVPLALIACALPIEQVRALIDGGHPAFAELAGAELVALPTGHWPMFSEPAALAAALDALTVSQPRPERLAAAR